MTEPTRGLAVVPANHAVVKSEVTQVDAAVLNRLLGENRIDGLTSQQKTQFLIAYHERYGLDPLSGAVRIISFRGAETIYITGQGCAQLRQQQGISLEILASELRGDSWYVHVRATTPSGRHDEDIGMVVLKDRNGREISGGDEFNVIIKKAITQAKNRATKSLCGLTGVLDDSELAAERDTTDRRVQSHPSMPTARPATAPTRNGNPGGGRALAAQHGTAAALVAAAEAQPLPPLAWHLDPTAEGCQAVHPEKGKCPSVKFADDHLKLLVPGELLCLKHYAEVVTHDGEVERISAPDREPAADAEFTEAADTDADPELPFEAP